MMPSLLWRATRPLMACTLVVALCAAPAMGQTTDGVDLLNPSPRGLTDPPARKVPIGSPSPLNAPKPASGPFVPGAQPAPAAAPMHPLPLPADPASAGRPLVFGSQIFSGRFGSETFAGFNPDYQIAVGDRISVRLWGAFTFDAVQPVDVRGNIFIPNVGPVNVLGIRNADLNRQLEAQLKQVFRSNVGVYATLEAAQPVKVYVTGFVRAPGLYGGLSSDSVLYYLDRAGGIDPERGSYLNVDVLRAGKPLSRINLYTFLLEGRMPAMQLQDGDTVVVQARRHAVQVAGEVANPYIFEIPTPRISGSALVALALPKPAATHLSIVRSVGSERRSDYYPLAAAADVVIEDGDEVVVTSDRYAGTILVRVEGAHQGERTLVLPYGSRLQDAIARIRPAPQARMEALQLFRKSVALRQKELIETSLRSLETYALTARSSTSEEAALRGREAQQILEFIDRARQITPRGQVIVAQGQTAGSTLLEDGDLLRIPEQSNLVLVSGEVMFPNALVYDPRATVEDYVSRAGGFTQGAERARLIVLRQDGSVVEAQRAELRPGDELMVLPKIETKSVEITRGITAIVYQIAVAAKVLFGL